MLVTVSPPFIASSEGGLVEISKCVLLSNVPKMLDDEEDYVNERDTHYPLINSKLWTIDLNSHSIAPNKMREDLDKLPSMPDLVVSELPGFLENIRAFEGWSVCVDERGFSKNDAALDCLWQNRLSETQANSTQSLPYKIIEAIESKGYAKADVRPLFPNLSVRQFDYYWRLAAEKNRKSQSPARNHNTVSKRFLIHVACLQRVLSVILSHQQ